MVGGSLRPRKGDFKMKDCEVKHNCITSVLDECWACNNYQNYNPKDKRIKCKRQIEKKAEKKADKKALKQTDASKRGRASKRKGYRGENELVHEFEKMGIQAKRQPLSGALKGSLGGDITIQIGDEKLRVESKLRADGFKEDYKYIEQDNADLVIKKADRKQRLVTMTWERFLWLLNKREGA